MGKKLTGKKIVGFMSKGGRYAFSNDAFSIDDNGHLLLTLNNNVPLDETEESQEVISIDLGRVVGGIIRGLHLHTITITAEDEIARTLRLITTSPTEITSISEETGCIPYNGYIIASYYGEGTEDVGEIEQATLALNWTNSEITRVRTDNYYFEPGNMEITELTDTVELIEL